MLRSTVLVVMGVAATGAVGASGGLSARVGPGPGVPVWVVAVALLLCVAAVGQKVGRVGRRKGHLQDPQRMYSPEQRREMFERAGNQCEYTGWAWQRCRAAAEHADHLMPWARGGATSLLNGVASCAHHNTSKGAKILPRRQVRALERRRRRYFPPGVDVRVGELYDPATTRQGEGRAPDGGASPSVVPSGVVARAAASAPPVPAPGAHVPAPREAPLW